VSKIANEELGTNKEDQVPKPFSFAEERGKRWGGRDVNGNKDQGEQNLNGEEEERDQEKKKKKLEPHIVGSTNHAGETPQRYLPKSRNIKIQ